MSVTNFDKALFEGIIVIDRYYGWVDIYIFLFLTNTEFNKKFYLLLKVFRNALLLWLCKYYVLRGKTSSMT